MLIFLGEVELIHRGAEADVYKTKWAGIDVIYKIRKRLNYRNSILDNMIRTQRTIREAQIMNRSKLLGVRCPYIYYLNPIKSVIIMEYIKGKRMKELLDIKAEDSLLICKKLGEIIGKLHNNNIIHGDLTTSNVILTGNELCLIDFGLSFYSTRLEDKAVDIRLIKEIMSSVHSVLFPECFNELIEGYIHAVGQDFGKKVLKQLASIERRGRYTKVS